MKCARLHFNQTVNFLIRVKYSERDFHECARFETTTEIKIVVLISVKR